MTDAAAAKVFVHSPAMAEHGPSPQGVERTGAAGGVRDFLFVGLRAGYGRPAFSGGQISNPSGPFPTRLSTASGRNFGAAANVGRRAPLPFPSGAATRGARILPGAGRSCPSSRARQVGEGRQ